MYYFLGITLAVIASFQLVHNNDEITENYQQIPQQQQEKEEEDKQQSKTPDNAQFSDSFMKNLEMLDDDDLLDEDDNSFLGRANEDTYCYARDLDPYHYFSTKTPYPTYENSTHLDPVPGCEVKYVWLLMRHGVRFGSHSKSMQYLKLGKLRDKIMENVGNDKTELCMDDILNFLLWMPINVESMKPNTLTPNGYKLARSITKKFKEKFSHLIPNKYDPKLIQIEYSEEEKVSQTVGAIMEELFGEDFLPDLPPDDVLNQVYIKCKRPKVSDRETNKNFTYLMEYSEVTRKMCEKVSLKLGFDETLDYFEVAKLHNGCQYEIAWGLEKSPWCAAFTKEDLQVMEYIGDISYYYFCGPGDVYNMFQGCVLLKNLVNQLMSAAASETMEDRHKMSWFLGHSTSVLMMISQLGIINDEITLTHKNYNEVSHRKWRTSHLSPYTANIIVILYKCNTGEKHRIKLLLNEKPIMYAGICDNNYLCSLNGFYKMFEEIITSEECSTRYCNHTAEEMCLHLKLTDLECEYLKKTEYMSEREQQSSGLPLKEREIKEMIAEYKHACILFCIILCILFFFLTKLEPHFTRTVKRSNDTTEKGKNDETSGKKENKVSSKPKSGKDKLKTNDSKTKGD